MLTNDNDAPQWPQDDDVEEGNVEDFQDEGKDAERGDGKVEHVPVGGEVAVDAQGQKFERGFDGVHCKHVYKDTECMKAKVV